MKAKNVSYFRGNCWHLILSCSRHVCVCTFSHSAHYYFKIYTLPRLQSAENNTTFFRATMKIIHVPET